MSPDGKLAITGSGEGVIQIWDILTGDVVRTLKGHTDNVAGVAFSPDGAQIVSGSSDHTVRVWDARPVSVPDN